MLKLCARTYKAYCLKLYIYLLTEKPHKNLANSLEEIYLLLDVGMKEYIFFSLNRITTFLFWTISETPTMVELGTK